jgi:hypothetical protein
VGIYVDDSLWLKVSSSLPSDFILIDDIGVSCSVGLSKQFALCKSDV